MAIKNRDFSEPAGTVRGFCDPRGSFEDSRLHICHIASALKGGSEIMISQLAFAQRKIGHRVSVVYSPLRDKLDEFRHLFPEDVNYIAWAVERDVTFSSDIRAYRDIKSILEGVRPDIVHLHNAKAGAHGRMACRWLGIPCIYTPHGLPFLRKDSAWWKRALHFASEWALALFGGRIVAVSDGEFAAIKFMLCQKSLIYNGVDVDAIRALAVSAAVTPKKHFRVVVSGRIETPKNPFLVARMASQSPENWEWIWIGDGSLRKPLEDSGRFVVTGWVDRPIALALVKSADAYIQASLWEGMSFALLEAMALGRTCIVSNVVGNRDLIKNGVSGYSCDNDEVRFLRILNHVSANPNDAERLGNRALDSVRQRFSLETMVGNWNNLYAKMIVRRHRAAGISG